MPRSSPPRGEPALPCRLEKHESGGDADVEALHRPRKRDAQPGRGARAHVAVSIFGKWKTTLQIIGISFMLYREPLFTLPAYRIGEWLVYAAAALTLWSMIDYLRAAWPAMRDHD